MDFGATGAIALQLKSKSKSQDLYHFHFKYIYTGKSLHSSIACIPRISTII